MMTAGQELSKYLEGIAEALDISETMRNKAISSYEAVGVWLTESEKTSDVSIKPQGSFALGTVIRPIDDRDEYDIDLVCLLGDKSDSDNGVIKNLVGDRLKEHGIYKNKLEPEGKRCWTLSYEEFHMDVLPCVPSGTLYKEPRLTEIKLTNKEPNGSYTSRFSNPYSYQRWFVDRMETAFLEAQRVYASSRSVDIDQVPFYAVKTPLQQAIQLLKRHRDIMYSSASSEDKDNAPISIIITTLAAMAYNNELTVYEALDNILSTMEKGIQLRGSYYWVVNPVMHDENFADKWNENPKKREEFFRWLKQAKYDLVTLPSTQTNLKDISELYKKSLGEGVTNKAFASVANAVKVSREAGSLFVAGTTKHLTTQGDAGSQQVKDHTFYGR